MGKKLTIEDVQDLAKPFGGKCLSKKYIDILTKYKWRCKEGHEWEARASHVKDGHWCPICAGIMKLTIEQMQELAKVKGGKCLSEKYVNARTNLKWKCKEGHIWEATPSSIISKGSWCRKCAGLEKLTIEQMQELAKQKGGKCLSEKYVSAWKKLKWQCKEGHVWESAPASIKQGKTWCPICARNRKLK